MTLLVLAYLGGVLTIVSPCQCCRLCLLGPTAPL
jgi:hypothetical protein